MAHDMDEEAERLLALRRLDVRTDAPEERFQRIVRLTRRLFDVRIAAVNLIEEDTHDPLAIVGAEPVPLPRSESLCAHTIEQDGVLEIHDLSLDPRSAASPMVVGDPHLRFYAGVPLTGHTGQAVGSLCVLDTRQRTLTEEERTVLRDLAAVVDRELMLSDDAVHAGKVQQSLLPRDCPDLPGLEVLGRVVPAREAGGDLYDWHVVEARRNADDADTVQVAVADVMGKGLSAALLGAGLRSTLRAHSAYVDLGRAVHRTNESVSGELHDNGSFITLWTARIDPATGDIGYVDAGHGLAMVLSPDGRSRRLTQPQLPLGLPQLSRWAPDTDRLSPGELLVVCSDGVLDAYGDVEALQTGVGRIAATHDTLDAVADALLAHASEHGSGDDLTVLLLRTAAAA